jgi:hypothetical protein
MRYEDGLFHSVYDLSGSGDVQVATTCLLRTPGQELLLVP